MRRNFPVVFAVFVLVAFFAGVYWVDRDTPVGMVDPDELLRQDAERNAPQNSNKNAKSFAEKGPGKTPGHPDKVQGEFSKDTLRKHTPLPKPASFKDTREMPLDTTPICPLDYTVSDAAFLAKVKELIAPLENSEADKGALKNIIVFLCRTGRPNEAVPYFDRYISAGGDLKDLGEIVVADVPQARGKSPLELIGTPREFYMKGLAMVGRFKEANSQSHQLETDLRGFSENGLSGIQLRFYELYYQARVKKDPLETAYAMERLNSRWPTGNYQTLEATANTFVIELLSELVSGEEYLNSLKRLDQLWAHLPAHTMEILTQDYLRRGLPLSPILMSASDPLMKGEFCNPAAMVRRSLFTLSRGGDSALALKQAKQAVTLAKSTGNKELELFSNWNLADVAHAVGDLETEAEAVEAGETLAKDSAVEGFKLNSSLRAAALCESLSDERRAIELYQAIIKLAKEKSAPATTYEALRRFHRFASRNVVPEDIEPELKQRADTLVKMGAATVLQAGPHLDLAVCYSRQKKTDDAARALAVVLKSGDPTLMTEAYAEIGQLCLNDKNGEEAGKAFAQGLQIEETQRSPELRWRLELGSARAKELQKDIPGARKVLGDLMNALDASGGKASSYHDRRRGLESSLDPYVYALELALAANDGTAAFSIAERARARAVFDAACGIKKLAPPAGTFEAVKAASAGRKTILYLMGNDVVYAWVVSGEAIVLERIAATRRELQREISGLFKAYSSAGSGDLWPAVSKKVFDRLWLPVAKHVKPGDRIAIVPHGIIHYVPFHALNDGNGFLVEQHEFSYAPTGGALAELSKRPITAPGNVLVFDPVFSTQANSPGRLTETQAIQSLFPKANAVLSAAASDGKLAEEAPSAGLLHICAYGKFDPWVPSRSGFEIWKKNEPEKFTLVDISALNLKNCELAFFNASMNSQTELGGGDEISAAMRSFQSAGARNVIGGMWKMELLPAFPIMRAFYENFKATPADPVKALALAQRKLLKDDPHPFTWAAYQINGAGK